MKRIILCFLITIGLLTVFLPVSASGIPSDYSSEHPENLNDNDLACSAAILMEAETGMVVYEKNADARMYPASTTKILTTYLGVLLGDMNRDVVMTASALNIESDASTIPLSEGEIVNFEKLLYATMVTSGNEGANLIAETLAGDVNNFSVLMNQFASSIGCTASHFANANGLHQDDHYTTARDLAIISREAMQNEIFRDIASTTSFAMPPSNVHQKRSLRSRMHEFFGDSASEYYYEYASGIKTGYTSKAGYCFVGYAEKDGVGFISVVLNTSSYRQCWSDTKKLMEYGFSQYVGASITALYNMSPKVIEISKYDLEDEQLGKLQLNITKLDPDANDIVTTLSSRLAYLSQNFNGLVSIEYVRDFVAPIEKDELMGIMTYYPEEGDPIEYELRASRSIARRTLPFPSLDKIIADTQSDPNPFPRLNAETVFVLVLLMMPLAMIIWLLIRFTHRKKKKVRRRVIRPITRYYR